jgi:hypothetical protein
MQSGGGIYNGENMAIFGMDKEEIAQTAPARQSDA